MHVYWVKRDARLRDNPALAAAARTPGPLLCLAIHEPDYWAMPEHDPSHYAFLRDGLEELDTQLRRLGQRLVHRTGGALDVLRALHRTHPITALFSHQETGGAVTFARDREVARWCRAEGIPWEEPTVEGVFRPHPTRDGWARRWEARMSAPPLPPPTRLPPPPNLPCTQAPPPSELGLGPDLRTHTQRPGEAAAQRTLSDFLDRRVIGYLGGLSSPVTAPEACSRLSAYLAWGHMSLRELTHALQARRAHLTAQRDAGEAVDPAWLDSLDAFAGRLRWRNHFMQKLEDEPELEVRNLHPLYDGLRLEDPARWRDAHHERLDAWRVGRTGWPLVDATMRCLHHTGWAPFRMRALVVSSATWLLWLHWRQVGLALAPLFLDYEPGIHWPQLQMQAGTAGINQIRIYNPSKQVLDHDPDGRFLRRWVPELARVPQPWLPEPWRMPDAAQREAGCIIGRDYPAPLVDAAQAARLARHKVERLRARADVQREAQRVHDRHGSRMPAHKRRWR